MKTTEKIYITNGTTNFSISDVQPEFRYLPTEQITDEMLSQFPSLRKLSGPSRGVRPEVKVSLEQSLRNNAGVWEELAKH